MFSSSNLQLLLLLLLLLQQPLWGPSIAYSTLLVLVCLFIKN
jgi:hypothetical protein